MTAIVAVSDPNAALTDDAFDAVVVCASSSDDLGAAPLQAAIDALTAVDESARQGAHLVPAEGIAGGRLVLSTIASLDKDGDDVRRVAEAARAGIERARAAGAKAPLLLFGKLPSDPILAHAVPVGALGALAGLWEPLEAREALGAEVEPVERLGLASLDGAVSAEVARWVEAVEGGRRVTRDLAGTNPERMAPPRFAAYCREAFADRPVDVTVVDDLPTLERDYPLLYAVARASTRVERHRPCVVRLSYTGEGPITQTLLLAGKGVTYDTGGADLKTGGHMAGMSRDKGGAAAAAGLVHAIATLRPKGVRVVAELGAVRNSIGSDAFVADEIITSHAGVRVRIGNTDAEGRLVLAECLSHLREMALEAEQRREHPQLFSIATLTGHAQLAVGPYSVAIDNRAARRAKTAERLFEQGELWGDPFEISTLRREDWSFIDPRSKADDVINCNNAPSSQTPRGHQFPAAFLAIASGLAAHGHESSAPALPYTHIDIAGSGVEGGDWQHGRPTAAPVVGMLCALVESARC